MGLFDNEKIPDWFQSLYGEFLDAYPTAKGAKIQDRKFWWGLKYYQPGMIERAMKSAALKYSNFPTVQSVIDLMPEGSRIEGRAKAESLKSASLGPKTQTQWALYREMLVQEKALHQTLAGLTWEYQQQEILNYREWYEQLFWPAYIEAGHRPDPPMTPAEQDRIHAHLIEFRRTFKTVRDGMRTETESRPRDMTTEKARFRDWVQEIYDQPPF
jgi:hypothetical protein